MKTSPSILIIAGEVSGDMHAARILRAMKELRPGLTAWGIGGDRLAAEGMEVLHHVRDMAVMGMAEVLRKYGFFRNVFHDTLNQIDERKPDLILLVDYPGFNLRLAAKMEGKGIPIVQYVCPQVWAWKKNRIPKMAQVLDKLIALFPFEPAVFEGSGLDVEYCGHPLVDETAEVQAATDWPETKRLLLLPGSRQQEITRLLEPMLGAATAMMADDPELSVRIAAGDAQAEHWIRQSADVPDSIPIVVGTTRPLLRRATAALVTSGTATLETALLGCPMVVVYKTSSVTYAIGKRVVQVDHIGMVNLVADREVCPELIQHEATPAKLIAAVSPLLEDSEIRQQMLSDLEDVRSKLISDAGGRNPAQAVLAHLKK